MSKNARNISVDLGGAVMDCAVFGHTHQGLCDIKNGITLLNPGSIRYGKTFGVIEIEDGKLRADILNA